MSDTNVKVGVFNVLANGVSYCSPLWESTTVKENQDKIFKALQALTLGNKLTQRRRMLVRSKALNAVKKLAPEVQQHIARWGNMGKNNIIC